jgi:hypothetical protein
LRRAQFATPLSNSRGRLRVLEVGGVAEKQQIGRLHAIKSIASQTEKGTVPEDDPFLSHQCKLFVKRARLLALLVSK